MEPLVISEQGHFFTGIREVTTDFGVSVTGTHVEYQSPPIVRGPADSGGRPPRPPVKLVLVHGGGGQALDMLATPDGREGWATLFLRDGFAVYTVDRPGMGRSPYHPAVYGEPGAPATYGSFVASFAGPSPHGLPEHTQWPGDGTRKDPALAQFLAGQEPTLGSLEAMRVGAVGLLDRIGASVLLTHSLGGAFGWLAASERRSLVKAIVAVEPAGPPEGDPKLQGLPVAVVTAECSGFGPACDRCAAYLRRCGADVTELRLAELGIHGNGHAMMLERNNAEIAAVLTDWISKHVEGQ
jgi:pimeloyl-ACP methyl ester carboxylesterase